MANKCRFAVLLGVALCVSAIGLAMGAEVASTPYPGSEQPFPFPAPHAKPWGMPHHPTGPPVDNFKDDIFVNAMPGIPAQIQGGALVNTLGVRTEAESWLHRDLHPNVVPPVPKAPEPLVYRNVFAVMKEGQESASAVPVPSLRHTQMDIPDPSRPATQPPSWEIFNNPSIPMPPLLSPAPTPPRESAAAAAAAARATQEQAAVLLEIKAKTEQKVQEQTLRQQAAEIQRLRLAAMASPIPTRTVSTTTYYSNPMDPTAVYPYGNQNPYSTFYPRDVRPVQLPVMPDNVEALRRNDLADTDYGRVGAEAPLRYRTMQDLFNLPSNDAPSAEGNGFHNMNTKSAIGATGYREGPETPLARYAPATPEQIQARLSQYSRKLMGKSTADAGAGADASADAGAEADAGADAGADADAGAGADAGADAEGYEQSFVEVEAETEVDADLEAEVDAEAETEADLEAEVDAEVEAETETKTEQAPAAKKMDMSRPSFMEVAGIEQRQKEAEARRVALLQQQATVTAGMDLEDALHTVAHGAPADIMHSSRLAVEALHNAKLSPAEQASHVMSRNMELFARRFTQDKSEQPDPETPSLLESGLTLKAPGGGVVVPVATANLGIGRPIGFPNAEGMRQAPFPTAKPLVPEVPHGTADVVQATALLHVSDGVVASRSADEVILADAENFKVPDSWLNAPHLTAQPFPPLVAPPRYDGPRTVPKL